MNFHLQSPSFPTKKLTFLHTTFQIKEFRVWRRRRLKFGRKITVCGQFSPPLENFFLDLKSQFPSVNSFDLIVPALGFASGVALYLSRLKSNRNFIASYIGDWILFTSPTPFNRFVLLRCPSIAFDEGELLENVNEKLVKEDRHFVRLNSGRIQWTGLDADSEQNLIYQRVCVSTEDGGVISLDWPASLDLMEERGMDTTVLLVPGTAEGSMDKNVCSFVYESLKRGCFPVVMNPRGCAGSPLTNARLFTAADSDDICTAIQFINRARPWTTLVGVGWGHGANMLTKYLAEVAEGTPLTAATCIDNPFDLEEATRSFPHHIAVDQKLTSGLVNILRSNKELFQGREKGFNVEKALSATSVRDFEKAVSMVSYGFETVEEFYSKSSTRKLVGNLKIPVLFIQSDDGTVPPFSIPRSSIAENPFTSLLLCSCLPSSTITGESSAISWCQHFAIEWLTAVELGLLKGRHPLLKDVDVTINPSKGLALVEGTVSEKDTNVDKLVNVNSLNGYSIDPIKNMIDESDTATNVHLRSKRNLFEGAESLQEENRGMSEQDGSVDSELIKGEGDNPVDNERSQVLQTAQIVMSMLDATMPSTLAEEQKKKVLTAMEQGESLMKALQGAVPEDVRGKLTSAVSEIMQTQGKNLNLDGMMKIGQIPNATSEVKLKIQETFRELSSATGRYDEAHSLGQMKMGDEPSGGSDKNQSGKEKSSGGVEAEIEVSQKLQKSLDQGQGQGQFQSASSHVVDISSSGRKDANESEQDHGKGELSGESVTQSSGYVDTGSGKGGKPNNHIRTEKAADSADVLGEQEKVNQGNGVAQVSRKEANDTQNNEEKSLDASTDQGRQIPTTKAEELVSPMVSSPEPLPPEKEGNDIQKIEDKSIQHNEDQNKQNSTKSEELTQSPQPAANPPTISVSQAFDALTGFDDSTQMAVNSVFGVLENMIVQLAEENEQGNDKRQDTDDDQKPSSASKESPIASEIEYKSRNKEYRNNELSLESDPSQSHDHPVNNFSEKCVDSHQDAGNRWGEEQLTQSCSSPFENDTGSFHGNDVSNQADEDAKRREDLIDSKLLAENTDKVGHVCKFPLYLTVNPYGDSLYNGYLRQYLLSKMPNTKPLDLDSTADLLLDYFPEEGQWKLLDQSGNNRNSVSNIGTLKGINGKGKIAHSPTHAHDTDKIIETSYVILDTENERQPVEVYKTGNDLIKKLDGGSTRSDELACLVKNIIFDSLKVEVGRRLGVPDMKEMEPNLAHDLEQVANTVSMEIGRTKELNWSLESQESASGKVGTLHGDHAIKTILYAVKDANYLRKALPVGVIVGSSLAALRKHFNVASQQDKYHSEPTLDQSNNVGKFFYGGVGEIGNKHKLVVKKDQYSGVNSLISGVNEKTQTVMVGAVTAALGASALLVNQQRKEPYECDETTGVSSCSLNEKGIHQKEHDKLLDSISEKNQNNIVSSLAEKAMSVAGPVVPTNSDGEVDQKRLVAMLADLGQKGGILRLIGKVALLWGGIRGAMSLTDRLILFLRFAERPLLQRILGFACMVLVLWSPVVIPLFPTLVQSWAARNSAGIAGYASVIGLYAAVMILIMLWGKRIRGYENPFGQYGLDLASPPKLLEFLKGLIGGVTLVLSIHSINVLLGCARFSWPLGLPSSLPDAMAWLKMYAGVLILTGQSIVTATGVAIVEELLFRSWLHEEIAVDLGYHWAVIISGLAFSILQRSLHAIPGLWLLSFALSGARQRREGCLSIPIGMRTGIITSSFILRRFLIYLPNYPLWVTGAHALQPFSGAIGLAFCLVLAVLLYPQQPFWTKKIQKPIPE